MYIGPHKPGTRFYRGNLHGHSNHSDGAKSPQQVAQFYKDLGYDFICISDHLWRNSKFAAESVLDTSHLRNENFTTLIGAEIHAKGKKYDDAGLWHIVANGLPADFEPASETETGPELIARAQAAGAFVTLAHPEWHCLTMDEALAASAAHGVEIYNHSCVIECDRGSGIAIADFLLNEGKRIVFTATDDSHFRIDDAAGGWVMVAAEENTPEALLDALKAGQHYSSTGPEIHSIALDGGQLEVRCSPASAIIVAGSGYMSTSVQGRNMTHGVLDLSGYDGGYIRIAVHDAHGGKAWTNPYWRD